MTEARWPKARASSVGRDVQAIRKVAGGDHAGVGTLLAPALDAAARGPANPGRRGRKLKLSPARRASLRLQGQYMRYLRSLKPRQKARAKALRLTKGIRAPIGFAKKLGLVRPQ